MKAHKPKQMTDITAWKKENNVDHIPTVKENVSLNDWDMKKTTRVSVIENRSNFKKRKLARTKRMINRVSKALLK